MGRIYVPSQGPESWGRLTAKPEQWRIGYSARTLAHSWEAGDGLPAEVSSLFEPLLGRVELVFTLPEHKVALPGPGHASQCDVFALLRYAGGLVTCAVEGKVDEPFGPTVGKWRTPASKGKRERLDFIAEKLGLHHPVADDVSYQLLHRTAAALIEAERFAAPIAAMIVHSFAAQRTGFDAFERFVALFGTKAVADEGLLLPLPSGKHLVLGWATGDPSFLSR